MSEPLSYIEACLLRVTAWLFFTYSINFICTNCATHVEVKTLQKLLCLQWSKYFVIDKRCVCTWNCRAPIEISAHSSSSKGSGAAMIMLARKRRINSSISNGSSNLSHRDDREKQKIRFIN